MRIKYINKDIEVSQGCFEVGTFYADHTVEKVYNLLKEMDNPVLFDIGANMGVFSLIATLISDLIVYAFEPFPKVCELLKRNTSLNGLEDRVKVFEMGLFNKKTTKKLKCCTGLNSGLSCMGPNFQLKVPYVEKEVEIDTIDNVVERENIKKIDFIKIDTEGCEYFILKGAEKTIKEYHPIILAECIQRRTVNFNLIPDDFLNLLKEYGYRSFEQFSKDDILAKKEVKK